MRANYSNGNPLFVGISASQNVTNTQFRADNPTPTTIKTSLSLCALLDAGTYYIYASNSAATTNPIFVYKYEIK